MLKRGDKPKLLAMSGHQFVRRYESGERDFRNVRIRDGVRGGTFEQCNFGHAEFAGSLKQVTLRQCDFSDATLTNCELQRVLLDTCVFDNVLFKRASFESCRLVQCQLWRCTMIDVNLHGGGWRACEVGGSLLFRVHFIKVPLAECEFSFCMLSSTAFTATRLDQLCSGRDIHFSPPCSVDWESICLSLRSPALNAFLTNAGMPDVFSTYAIECARSLDPDELFRLMKSAFISYGGPDAAFARRLRDTLQRNGVRAFLFDVDATPGERLHRVMHRAVNEHDRVILICSASSLDRPGVLNEIETTLAREARDGGASYLIPVTLDDYVFDWQPSRADLALQVRDRVIADFRDADKSESKFRTGVQQLLSVLAISH